MSTIELITILITLISLTSFGVVFTILFSHYCNSSSREVLAGKRDIELLDNELAEKRKRPNPKFQIVKKVVSSVILGVLLICFGVSIYKNISHNIIPIGDSTILSVASGSMSKKHQNNDYLVTNHLDDQFNTYDIIVIHRTKESELKLYDVVAYLNENKTIIIHRIVRIERTVDGLKYHTRGDANNATDTYTPTFSDIVGEYHGERVPYIGIFTLFLQSYSGMITIAAIAYCLWMFDHFYSRLKKTCQERVDILLSLVKGPFDPQEFKTSFLQYIYYRGFIYEFENGVFKSKIEASDEKKEVGIVYVISQSGEKLEIKAQNNLSLTEKNLTEAEKQKTLEEVKNKIKE